MFRPSWRAWHVAAGCGLGIILYSPYLIHEGTHRFAETRALVDFIGFDQAVDRSRAWRGVAVNLVLLFRPALKGFVTDPPWPGDDWHAFATLYTAESILFVFGVWRCLGAVTQNWPRSRVEDVRRARVSAILLLWLAVPLIALGFKRTEVLWYYLDVLYPSEFIFVGIGASALLSLSAVGPRMGVRVVGVGVIAALVAIVASQAVFQIGLQRRTADQGEALFDVRRLVIGSPGIELAGLRREQMTRVRPVIAALPYGHREKILEVLHQRFHVDQKTLWQRVHGDVLGFPAENEYFVQRIFSPSQRPESSAERGNHYLVERSTRTGAQAIVPGAASVGPYTIAEYQPRIDYGSWSSTWALDGAIGNVPERSWRRMVFPWTDLSDPPPDSGVMLWRGTISIPRGPCGFQLNVSTAGAETIERLWVEVNGRHLAPTSLASWASPWHYWRTTGAWDLDCALGTGKQQIVVGVETQKRLIGVDVYEGTASPRMR
jgi:hypothetical protein